MAYLSETAAEVHPKLVAAAGVHREYGQIDQNKNLEFNGDSLAHDKRLNNFFKAAIWSPDGTSVITNSDNNHINTYVIPPDLLDDRSEPLSLTPYTTIPSYNSIPTFTPYPYFTLSDPNTTLILSSCHQHPIRLHNICDPPTQAASYPFINSQTEAYITPQSLLFLPDGANFIAGTDSSIAIFDVSRPGGEPLLWYRTGPRRLRDSNWANPATSLKGIVSTLALDNSTHQSGAGHGLLAAGSFSRQVGLYDAAGRGECVAAFSVAGLDVEARGVYRGTGITQVIWSGCGRYLFVVERKSDGLLVYDVRKTGELCGLIGGRKALTNQRMNVSVVQKEEMTEVWAGGTDGVLRRWENPQLGALEQQAGSQPTFEQKVHDTTVNGVAMHPVQDVLVTASGQRSFSSYDDSDSSHADSSPRVSESTLKLWHMEQT